MKLDAYTLLIRFIISHNIKMDRAHGQMRLFISFSLLLSHIYLCMQRLLYVPNRHTKVAQRVGP